MEVEVGARFELEGWLALVMVFLAAVSKCGDEGCAGAGASVGIG